ncbi:Shedu anti-phage system protein SduA domain-containing protein [Microvirga pudoricolor]|uniref:Shedu anti-phage system protein SduA domain-containing protein n=1 Tax=Microvirga pudoricolor TaxID=2778729 RepID=UPI00194F5527|nr:Shedu anti-phage system protein SduA domain-containing protein [Microvirga pudoricolor]MBM6594015.1 DUF4263 domain-containing protein [Microvirga pudoricolor]
MKVRVNRYDREERPNLQSTTTAVLKDGPRVRRVVKHTVILDEHTGEFHHDALTIKSYELNKTTCTLDPARSIHLDGEQTQKLIDFVVAARSGAVPEKAGGYLVLPATKANDTHVLSAIQGMAEEAAAEALALLLRQGAEHPERLRAVLERVAKDGDEFLAKAAAAINLAVYKRAVAELERLIEDTQVREHDLQRLLTENPWMFGSEYSRLSKSRRLTRDEQQDFLLTRTTDGYLEVVEIKTPLAGADLFAYDKDHKTFYKKADLSKVIAQVENYLEKLDRRRDTILADDGLDPNKVRAKIVIGRDGDDDQTKALRRTNGHLSRIEVITFDGLLRIAQQVLSYLENPDETETP